ncbi:MAG: NADH dehydrogenase [candidate division Zixibacteria bacterium SM23_73]|nr:MAG: NADH dehydrogenase [candidate division Zixibacteria bacterium SM23_73]
MENLVDPLGRNPDTVVEKIDTEEFIVNMGPQHPSTHGVCRLLLKMDGEVIVDVVPYVGYLHRSMEKIAENRTYLQYIPLTDRIDYVSAMFCNHVFCMTVEKLAQIHIPERAEYIRVIMDELNRIASHLIWLATFALDLGAITPFLYCFREREKVLDLLEMVSGQRMTFNYMRFGGVSKDLPPEFIPKTKEFVEYFKPRVDEYEYILTNNPIFLGRTKGVGILDQKTAIDYSVTGPNLRATGLKWDLRKEEPYSVYDRFEFDIPTGANSDTWDRYMVRIQEMRQANRIVEQALESLPEGEIKTKTPTVFRPPKGEVYARIESTRGEMGFYIVSDGSTKPYRLKMRTASFSNLAVLPEMSRGWKIADIVAIFASLDVIMPDVDR